MVIRAISCELKRIGDLERRECICYSHGSCFHNIKGSEHRRLSLLNDALDEYDMVQRVYCKRSLQSPVKGKVGHLVAWTCMTSLTLDPMKCAFPRRSITLKTKSDSPLTERKGYSSDLPPLHVPCQSSFVCCKSGISVETGNILFRCDAHFSTFRTSGSLPDSRHANIQRI